MYLATIETDGHHNANFVVIGGTAGCRYDKLQCRQWLQS